MKAIEQAAKDYAERNTLNAGADRTKRENAFKAGAEFAIEKIALRICEAQITIVKNEVMKFANKKSMLDVIATIDNCGHPKFDESWLH